MKTLTLALFGSLLSAQAPPFQHVIVIVQENRTPDNLFQGLCSPPYGSIATCSTKPNAKQYNIQTANWMNQASSTGVTKPTALPLFTNYDPSHTHAAFVQMCDVNPATGACRVDGAAGVSCSGCPPNSSYTYVDNSTGLLDPYLDLATQFGWANYMFQTNQGPSFPAHLFLFGGTSAPSAADDAAGVFAAENLTANTSGATGAAGCISPAGSSVLLLSPRVGENQSMYPCFDHLTIPDLLPVNFSWKYYAPSSGFSIWAAPNAIRHICESTGPGGHCTGADWTNHMDANPTDVLTNIASCNLPSLSWVVPTAANSDHSGVNDGGGPSWVAAIVNAVGATSYCDYYNGYWENTAILITWDDWGGWYDHVSPPLYEGIQGDYQFGFRVPLIVVSAYTPAGYINNNQHDFGSILRFIEYNFGIPEGALNFADARATNDLTNFFTLNAPQSFKALRAPKDATFFLNDARKQEDPDDDQ
jgi:phospholipase C